MITWDQELLASEQIAANEQNYREARDRLAVFVAGAGHLLRVPGPEVQGFIIVCRMLSMAKPDLALQIGAAAIVQLAKAERSGAPPNI